MDNQRMKELAGVVAAPTEQEKVLAEGMFGREGYGGEKSGEGQIVSELAQMLRDIKMAIRDGNMEDATMLVDRAYSRAAGGNRGA